MRALIDIGHPAHVHYFKHIVYDIFSKGGQVLFTTRDKDVTINLLKHYSFEYINMGKPFKTLFGKVLAMGWFTIRLFFIAVRFKPDFVLNSTHYGAWVAFLLRRPHIAIEDSFNMEQVRFYLPFTNIVLTPSFPHISLGSKEIQYKGYQELLYLHPNRFTPDRSIFKELNIESEEVYAVIRFVSWNASHDLGKKGLSFESKLILINEIKKYARVFITSENPLEPEFEPYRISLPAHRMHDLLSFAHLFLGEGATMASEAAILGTPAIYINPIERGYVSEAAVKYGLSYDFRHIDGAVEQAVKLLKQQDIKNVWQVKLESFFKDMIDPTALLIWILENYPSSINILKEDPDYQLKFR